MNQNLSTSIGWDDTRRLTANQSSTNEYSSIVYSVIGQNQSPAAAN